MPPALPSNVIDMRNAVPPARLDVLDPLLTACDVHLVSCRYWLEGPAWRVEPRTVSDTFLLIPTVGGFVADVGGREYPVTRGRAMLLADDVRHSLRTLDGCLQLEQISLHCHVWDAFHQPFARRFADPVQVIDTAPAWESQLRLLCTLDHERHAAAAALATVLLPVLFGTFLLHGARLHAPHSTPDERMRDTLTYIRAHLRDALPVTFLAERVGLQPGRLRALFHAATGQSPNAYIANERLQRAARLLRRTRRPVHAIAADVGFLDPAYFDRRFRERYSSTPTAYRQAQYDV